MRRRELCITTWVNEAILQISLIKLERMGLISKAVETDHQDGYDFYAYSITELGVDELLKNEENLQQRASNPVSKFDDEIPF